MTASWWRGDAIERAVGLAADVRPPRVPEEERNGNTQSSSATTNGVAARDDDSFLDDGEGDCRTFEQLEIVPGFENCAEKQANKECVSEEDDYDEDDRPLTIDELAQEENKSAEMDLTKSKDSPSEVKRPPGKEKSPENGRHLSLPATVSHLFQSRPLSRLSTASLAPTASTPPDEPSTSHLPARRASDTALDALPPKFRMKKQIRLTPEGVSFIKRQPHFIG